MPESVRQKPKYAQLSRVEVNAVSVLQPELVRESLIAPHQSLPLVLTPATQGVDLVAWAGRNLPYLKIRLLKHGGILFRNFTLNSTIDFERVIEVISGEALEYVERSSPRHSVGGRIYTSTDYPPDHSIFPHNENSYAHMWPLKIYFYCVKPADQGGETPLVDVRRVYRRLSSSLIGKFARRKVMYVRNYGPVLGLRWQTAFQSDSRAAVEDYCRASDYAFQWREGDCLRTQRIGQAIASHPDTGEMVWFNHAAFFHVSTLGLELHRALLSELDEEDLPNNTYYGNGTPIEPDALDEIRAAYQQEMVSFRWHAGDLLLLDNMLVAHARAPFSGSRQVLVGMAEPFQSQSVPALNLR